MTGDLPTDRKEICAILKRSLLPYTNTLTITGLDNTFLNIKGPKDWKLYDLTLREVIALKCLLAEEGINVDHHNIHF